MEGVRDSDQLKPPDHQLTSSRGESTRKKHKRSTNREEAGGGKMWREQGEKEERVSVNPKLRGEVSVHR